MTKSFSWNSILFLLGVDFAGFVADLRAHDALFLHLFDVHCGPLSTEPGPVYDCPPPYDELFFALRRPLASMGTVDPREIARADEPAPQGE